MDEFEIILLGVGLAMDCFAVSITSGMQTKQCLWRGPLLMAFLFGFFQGGMPLIGFVAGSHFATFFSRFAPWIALALLGFLGGKMIAESLKKKRECPIEPRSDVFAIKHLLLLAVATSIDALATGVIFIPTPSIIWLAIGFIALTSFIFSIAGYLIGVVFGCNFRVNVELIGGLILVAIGLKIFIEGICF